MIALTRPSPRPSSEEGLTLVELVVAMGILSIVIVVFSTTLSAMQRAVVEQEVRDTMGNQARLALQTIDRQVRSGNILYSPGTEVDPISGATGAGYMMRVYTQTNFPTNGAHCALWLIDAQQQLKYRWWPANQPEDASDWRVITDGVVNRAAGVPVFSLSGTGRTMTVTFLVNADYEDRPSATQRFSASLTGRNTSYGYPYDVCEDLPA